MKADITKVWTKAYLGQSAGHEVMLVIFFFSALFHVHFISVQIMIFLTNLSQSVKAAIIKYSRLDHYK